MYEQSPQQICLNLPMLFDLISLMLVGGLLYIVICSIVINQLMLLELTLVIHLSRRK